MTDLLLSTAAARCQCGGLCDRAPCFLARLEAGAAGHHSVRRHAELCAEHLGGAVQALAAWARDQGLDGQVTVLAIDQPTVGLAASPASPGRPDDRAHRGFAFGTVLLNP